MKGSLIRYNLPWSSIDFLGIIIESIDGFHVRKSWSEKGKFIKQPIVKIHWLNEPLSKPPSARREIAESWKDESELSINFIENTNSIIDEWPTLVEEYEWYFPDHFDFLEMENV